MFDAANRNNTAIYAVDPRGLATGEFDITDNISHAARARRALQRDAWTRCGRWPRTPTAAPSSTATTSAAGMKQIIRDSSAYYLVGYNSTQAPTDGKFHEIKVRVKRPGVQVRARKGYWAYTDADVEARDGGAEGRPAAGGDQGAGRASRR